MSDAVLSTPVTINRADGSILTFKRCSPADRIAFRSIFRLYRKHWLVQSLQVLGITGKDALPHLNELDARRLYESHVIQWLNEPEGQNEAILLSVRTDKPAATMADVYAMNLDDDERLEAAAGVMGIKLVTPKAEGSSGPLPTNPAPASGGTGTGGETPASSSDSPAPATP